MKTKFFITAIFVAVTFLSCDNEIEKLDKQKVRYTFNVFPTTKNTPFQAEIVWGVNKIEYRDKVGFRPQDTWLYASGYRIADGDKFIIQVNSTTVEQLKLEITQNETTNSKTVVIKVNQEYQF